MPKRPKPAGGDGRERKPSDAAPTADSPSGLAPWTEERLLRRTLEARLRAASRSTARAQLERYARAGKRSPSERRKALKALLDDDAKATQAALDFATAAAVHADRLDQPAQIVIHIPVPSVVAPEPKK